MQMPCDELITRPRCPADCPRSSNRNEMESFMEAAKAQNWAVEPQEKNNLEVSGLNPRWITDFLYEICYDFRLTLCCVLEGSPSNLSPETDCHD
jgi:hypothetical protein